MRRLLLLGTLAFVVSLFLAPSAVAQYVEEEKKGEPPLEEKMESPAEEKMEEAMEPVPDPPFAQEKQMEKEKAKAEKAKAPVLPKTGGPSVSVILPVGALLLVGSGVLAYAVVVRRR
jgi:LPXTG-motif cell wall-anchored protein